MISLFNVQVGNLKLLLDFHVMSWSESTRTCYMCFNHLVEWPFLGAFMFYLLGFMFPASVCQTCILYADACFWLLQQNALEFLGYFSKLNCISCICCVNIYGMDIGERTNMDGGVACTKYLRWLIRERGFVSGGLWRKDLISMTTSQQIFVKGYEIRLWTEAAISGVSDEGSLWLSCWL